MNFFKRACTLALAAALCVTCLTGCNSGGAASSSAADAPSANIPESIDLSTVTDPFLTTSGVSGDTVVGSVGEIDITAAQLLYWIAYGGDSLYQYYNAYGMTEPGIAAEEPGEIFKGSGLIFIREGIFKIFTQQSIRYHLGDAPLVTKRILFFTGIIHSFNCIVIFVGSNNDRRKNVL